MVSASVVRWEDSQENASGGSSGAPGGRRDKEQDM